MRLAFPLVFRSALEEAVNSPAHNLQDDRLRSLINSNQIINIIRESQNRVLAEFRARRSSPQESAPAIPRLGSPPSEQTSHSMPGSIAWDEWDATLSQSGSALTLPSFGTLDHMINSRAGEPDSAYTFGNSTEPKDDGVEK